MVTAVGYTVSYFMTAGPQVTPAVAAFAVGLAGQAYGRFTGKLSYVPLLSGVLLLVPGSVGVRSVLSMIGSDPSQGFSFALTMVNISVSITVSFLSLLPVPFFFFSVVHPVFSLGHKDPIGLTSFLLSRHLVNSSESSAPSWSGTHSGVGARS